MVSSDRLSTLIKQTQPVYADLFVRFEQVAALDPDTDAREIERLNAQIAELMKSAEAKMAALRPELEQWRERREDYPDNVNQFVERFLSLLETGLTEALGQLQQRSAGVSTRRNEIRAALAAIKRQRHGVAGYKSGAPKSPKLFDSEV